MNDEWRLQVDPRDPKHAQALTERLEARELKHDLSEAFHDRVIVSRDDTRVFLYAGSREQAESAHELILKLAQEHGWDMDLDLKRWHPTAEDWEDPDKALPEAGEARSAEHEALMAAERKQTEERGYPEFEVRANLPSRHDALHFAERLHSAGYQPSIAGSTCSSAPRTRTTPKPSPSESKARRRPAAKSKLRAPGRRSTPSVQQTRSRCWAGSAVSPGTRLP